MQRPAKKVLSRRRWLCRGERLRPGRYRWWNGVLAVFPEWRPEVADVREVNGRVVVRARPEGSGTGSGIALQRDIGQVRDVRDARITSRAFFRTEQEALEAAGLPQ